MPNLTLSTTILLPALLVAGVVGTLVFSSNNGLFDTIKAHLKQPAATLAGTDAPIERTFTGIGPVDEQLRFLLAFFWPILNGENADVSLQATHFFGQAGAYWTVMVLEGMRARNKGRMVAYTTIVGLIYQNATVAVTIPAWCLLDLLTLPDHRPAAGSGRPSVAAAADVRALPYAVCAGYIVPSLAMALPSPGLVSHPTKQTLASIWQAFPLWISLSHALIRPLFNDAPASSSSSSSPSSSISISTHRALSSTHLFALLFAVTTHTATLSLSLSSLLFPALLSPTARASLHPAHVFLPRVSAPGTALTGPHGGVADGVLRFMQWDEAVSVAAACVWAGALYARDAARSRSPGSRALGGVLARALGWSVVGGPAAAAVALLWARDDLLLARGESSASKVV